MECGFFTAGLFSRFNDIRPLRSAIGYRHSTSILGSSRVSLKSQVPRLPVACSPDSADLMLKGFVSATNRDLRPALSCSLDAPTSSSGQPGFWTPVDLRPRTRLLPDDGQSEEISYPGHDSDALSAGSARAASEMQGSIGRALRVGCTPGRF